MKVIKTTILVLVISAVLVLALGTTALAASPRTIENKIALANQMIQAEIRFTLAFVDKLDDRCPERLRDELYARAAAQLVERTSKISENAMKAADKAGVTVECELVPVTIGNVTVYVDPLHVISD